jgi:hypothetical protein
MADHGHLNQKDDNEIPVDYQNHLLDDRVNHFHQLDVYELILETLNQQIYFIYPTLIINIQELFFGG